MTPAAARYGLNELMRRATGGLPSRELGINVVYGNRSEASNGPTLRIRRAQDGAVRALLNVSRVDWIDADGWGSCEPDGRLPVILWGEGAGAESPLVERPDPQTVVVNVDLIASTVFMLTRWEEIAVEARDKHDRFPALASLAGRAGFLDRPVIDEYALLLRRCFECLVPGWLPPMSSFAIRTTHDVDWPAMLPTRRAAFIQLVRDLLERRDATAAIRTCKALVRDPWTEALYELASLSRKRDLAGAFYLMAATPQFPDLGYSLTERRLADFVRWLTDQGIEIGFHAGYYTYNDWTRFEVERDRLTRVLGKVKGGRQHVLRFDASKTWRLWERAGFAYDSTVGYADAEGFRCGTCHPFVPFDLEWQRELKLFEEPLIVMDATLRNYRQYSTHEAADRIALLATRCRRVGGRFVILWHNNCLTGDWQEWGDMYRSQVNQRFQGTH